MVVVITKSRSAKSDPVSRCGISAHLRLSSSSCVTTSSSAHSPQVAPVPPEAAPCLRALLMRRSLALRVSRLRCVCMLLLVGRSLTVCGDTDDIQQYVWPMGGMQDAVLTKI